MITPRIAIYDNLKSERDIVKGLLHSFFAVVSYECVLAEHSRGETVVDDYDDDSVDFDLTLMDVFMDGMLGMKVVRCLRRYAPHMSIVFLAITPACALESYDMYAYGCLVKPLDEEGMVALLKRFSQEKYEGNQEILLLKKGCRGCRAAYRETEYIESHRNMLLVSLENEGEYRAYAKLDDAEKESKGHGFLRCHQSLIMNMNRVRAAEEGLLMVSGAHIPIRQRSSYAIQNAYSGYLLEQVELIRIQYRRKIYYVCR